MYKHTNCVQVESNIDKNRKISIDTKILANTSLELYVTHLQLLLKQSWTNIFMIKSYITSSSGWLNSHRQ